MEIIKNFFKDEEEEKLKNFNNIIEQLEKQLENIEEEEKRNLKRKLVDLNEEINLINSKRDNLWKTLKKLHIFLMKIGNLNNLNYKDFIKEKTIMEEDVISKKEISKIRQKLEEKSIILKSEKYEKKVILLKFLGMVFIKG